MSWKKKYHCNQCQLVQVTLYVVGPQAQGTNCLNVSWEKWGGEELGRASLSLFLFLSHFGTFSVVCANNLAGKLMAFFPSNMRERRELLDRSPQRCQTRSFKAEHKDFWRVKFLRHESNSLSLFWWLNFRCLEQKLDPRHSPLAVVTMPKFSTFKFAEFAQVVVVVMNSTSSSGSSACTPKTERSTLDKKQ